MFFWRSDKKFSVELRDYKYLTFSKVSSVFISSENDKTPHRKEMKYLMDWYRHRESLCGVICGWHRSRIRLNWVIFFLGVNQKIQKLEKSELLSRQARNFSKCKILSNSASESDDQTLRTTLVSSISSSFHSHKIAIRFFLLKMCVATTKPIR